MSTYTIRPLQSSKEILLFKTKRGVKSEPMLMGSHYPQKLVCNQTVNIPAFLNHSSDLPLMKLTYSRLPLGDSPPSLLSFAHTFTTDSTIVWAVDALKHHPRSPPCPSSPGPFFLFLPPYFHL